MTKIIAISDLHWEGSAIMPQQVEKEMGTGDILILAGDIVTARAVKSGPKWLPEFFAVARDRFQHIVSVPGNHEPYGMEFNEAMKIMEEFYEAQGVWMLDNAFLEVSGVRLFGGLMGSNFNDNPLTEDDAARYINDYRLVTYGEAKWSTKDTKAQHDRFCEDVQRYGHLDVVISHFSPSMRSCHVKWGTNPLNHYFHNSDEALIKKVNPKLWVHGHTHDPSAYMVGTTRVYCNPRGYRGENNVLKLNEVIEL